MSDSTVRCTHCGQTYDLTTVKVTARFDDCTCFDTPCCGKNVDDRTWVSLPAITRVTDERRRVWEEYEASGELRFPRG